MLKNIFYAKGRSNKREYCLNILFFICLIIFRVYFIDQYRGVDKNSLIIILNITTALFVFLWIIQYFPLAIRRLHDLNASGWYVLLTFAPFGQFLILWLMFKKGTPGPNKYGEPPEY